MLPERKIYTKFDKLITHLIRGHVKTNKLFWSKVARGVTLLHIPLVNAICLSGGGEIYFINLKLEHIDLKTCAKLPQHSFVSHAVMRFLIGSVMVTVSFTKIWG